MTYPSSLYTIPKLWRVPRYLITPATGCGPWILDFATSNGILMQEAKVPDTNPMATFRKNSLSGSWKKIVPSLDFSAGYKRCKYILSKKLQLLTYSKKQFCNFYILLKFGSKGIEDFSICSTYWFLGAELTLVYKWVFHANTGLQVKKLVMKGECEFSIS